ncbi:MAG TPA: NADH-quinone oxidoreductase subunit C [Anaeromyxobacter sp.]
MTTHDVHERLKARFGDDVGPLSEPKIDPFCVVKKDRLVEVCRFLKTEPGLELDFLEDETAVDWPKRNVIEIVYHLLSYKHRHSIVLKVEVARDAASAPTVEGVWKTANWFEREIYDLFGVEFPGHPDLRRIMLPDDWIGHPLRKDYQEAGGWHGMSNVRENPLVELKRLDDARKAEKAPKPVEKAAEPKPAASGPQAS